MTTRKQAIADAGRIFAEGDLAAEQRSPREQAMAAYTPTPCVSHKVVHTFEELERMIRADRGLPPLPPRPR